MDLQIWQVIILTIWAGCIKLDRYGMAFGLKYPVITGLFAGLIMGDMPTGLLVGGTLELMSLGVAAIAGSSVPDYASAAIIATVVAVTTGKGMEAGLALGLPVGMLGVQLDVLAKLACGFVNRKAQEFANQKNFKMMLRVMYLGPVFFFLAQAVPVFISITVGVSVIETILNVVPAWVSGGLTIAGKLLPITGVAMLLKYMPVGKYFNYLLIGFFLAAYLATPILGVAIVGFALAFSHYHNKVNNEVFAVQGGMEDE